MASSMKLPQQNFTPYHRLARSV